LAPSAPNNGGNRKDVMPELINRAQANGFFITILILGIVTYFVTFSKTKSREKSLLFGGPLVLVGILWWVYNAITDKIGLNTVLNLWVNAILFIIVGIACGVFYRKTQEGLTKNNQSGEDGQNGTGVLVGTIPVGPQSGSGERTIEETLEQPRDFG
jgi:membrane protein implicated in regulation of membrane protease activity